MNFLIQPGRRCQLRPSRLRAGDPGGCASASLSTSKPLAVGHGAAVPGPEGQGACFSSYLPCSTWMPAPCPARGTGDSAGGETQGGREANTDAVTKDRSPLLTKDRRLTDAAPKINK